MRLWISHFNEQADQDAAAAAAVTAVDVIAAGGDADGDGVDLLQRDVIGPSAADAMNWKQDAWVDAGRYSRVLSVEPPIASLQYQFDVPFDSTASAWALQCLPNHNSDHSVAGIWHGHPAIGDHPGMSGYVSPASRDPRVCYAACTGLLPRTVNQFRVRAVNAVGPGDWSEPSCGVKTTKTAPLPPGPVRIKGRADNLLSLYWAPARPNGFPVTQYHLEGCMHEPADAAHIPRSTESTREQWFVVRDDLVDTFCLVPGLKYGCGYKFRVKAKNHVGWSLWSEPDEVIRTSRLLS